MWTVTQSPGAKIPALATWSSRVPRVYPPVQSVVAPVVPVKLIQLRDLQEFAM